MKITLEFNGDDEWHQAQVAIRSGEYAAAIDGVYNYIRGILKHTDASEEVEKHLEHIRSLLPSTDV